MATKKVKKEEGALAKTKAPTQLDLVAANAHALQGIAHLVSAVTNCKEEEQGEAVVIIRNVGKVVEAAEDTLKKRVIEWMKTHGNKATEAGTLRASVGGFVVEVQPTRTGIDSKKLEALLQSKAIAPVAGMDAVVTYKVNDGKLADLVAKKKLTTDEVETCRYDSSFKLMTPKKEE